MIDLRQQIDERVKQLAAGFRDQVQAKGPQAKIDEEFMAFVTERLAQLEVTCQGVLAILDGKADKRPTGGS